jgi:GDP-mannose 6-dehydrogenase
VKIAIFGLGYVGCVSAASFAQRGHDVIGVDTNAAKVDAIARGRTPVLEPGLQQLIQVVRANGRLQATTDPAQAVSASDISIVCVGTPSAPNGSLSLDAIERVTSTIGKALPAARPGHTVVIRSTVLPGTTENVIVPLLEHASDLVAGSDFGVVMNPEFLREGSALEDFDDPPKTVIGEHQPGAGDDVALLYEDVSAPLFRVRLRVAEAAKYIDNAFHALKIGFANEIGAFCKALGLDSYDVIEPFLSDHKLNISEAYLRPGFAFGGSCLPKDVRALLYAARRADLELPLLESILPSNQRHLQRTINVILALGKRRVGMLGLAFKPGIDDLRESPLVELAETLLGKGFDVRIHDEAVTFSRLVGANREYINEHLPHLANLMVDTMDAVVAHSEVCVVGANSANAVEAIAYKRGLHVVDLVRLPDAAERRREEAYIGVAW